MNLSLELPTAHLNLSELLDVDFCLAQNVLEDSAYASFYFKQVSNGRLVIMDNGFHELGRPMSIAELKEACKRIKPTFVCAPDWLGKGQESFDAWMEATEKLTTADTRVALALQTEDEQLLTYIFSAAMSRHCPLMCFPYRLNRRKMAEILLRKFRSWPPYVHLFGVSSLEEILSWRNLTRIKTDVFFSVDTAKPVKLGIKLEKMHIDNSMRNSGVASADLHLQVLNNDQLRYVHYNIAYLRRFC